MAIYALGELEPEIDATAYIHPDAVIIGRVVIGPGASVWPCAVLRGDDGTIRIGARTSVQDGSVLHCTAELDTVVGSEAVIGHMVHLEGCTVEDRALVGNGSVVLHRAVISTGALVGSNAVVPAGMVVPPGAMALGVPAKLRENVVDPEAIVQPMASYVARAERYRSELRRLD
jgi:carbonic anhydrase/acetyltransferase-like protein (isoleucine patch superfamily)